LFAHLKVEKREVALLVVFVCGKWLLYIPVYSFKREALLLLLPGEVCGFDVGVEVIVDANVAALYRFGEGKKRREEWDPFSYLHPSHVTTAQHCPLRYLWLLLWEL